MYGTDMTLLPTPTKIEKLFSYIVVESDPFCKGSGKHNLIKIYNSP
jgi:hypothetical protein